MMRDLSIDGSDLRPEDARRTPRLMLGAAWLLLPGCVLLPACGRTEVASKPDVELPSDAPADAGSCVHPAVRPRCHDGTCFVPAGCYWRGSPPDEPGRCRYCEDLRETTLTHPLAVGQFEVTHAEWTAFGYAIPPPMPDYEVDRNACSEPTCPITRITWHEAVAFANEKSVREGRKACIELLGCSGTIGADFDCTGFRQTTASYYDCDGYRVPTSAEFEYVARAGTRTAFYSGPYAWADENRDCAKIPHLREVAWYCANAKRTTHPVGQKKPNDWGLHDVLGNAWEYTSSPSINNTMFHTAMTDPERVVDPVGLFVVRGGSFSSQPGWFRSASQFNDYAVTPREVCVEYASFCRDVTTGVRLVRSLSPAEVATW